MLDAYTVRKAVPRLVVAVIAINLSIYLCVAALDIAIIVGKGLNQLLVAPFVNSNSFSGVGIEANTENSITGILGFGALGALIYGSAGIIGAAGVGTVSIALLGLLLPLVITVALMALAIVFTLVIWQALVIFLTVVSPVAIACYVLPGTEKYFRQWWDLFLRTLIVFPMIAVFFAMSNVMASILLSAAGKTGDGIGLAQLLAVVVVVFAPLVLIPFAFKLSGGLISQVGQFAGGQASGLSRRAGQAIRQQRKDPSSWFGRNTNAVRSAQTEKGYTASQMIAGRPFGNRAGRMETAKMFDRKKIQAITAEDHRAKVGSHSSDVQDALLMTKEQAVADRARIRGTMDQIREDHGNGLMSDLERDDALRAAHSRLEAHDAADMIGRTAANRQAAFFSSERIKFTGNSHAQEMALAGEIFGEGGVADAMNEHQAIAKGPAGRPDLAGSLYGQQYDLDRASEQQSMYQLMNQGRPSAIRSLAEQHIARLSDPTATSEAKRRSAAFLHSLEGAKGSGTPANNRVINDLSATMGAAINTHLSEQASEILTTGVPATRERVVQQTTTDPITGTQTTRNVTETVPIADPNEEALRLARRRMQQESQTYNPPDPSERETP